MSDCDDLTGRAFSFLSAEELTEIAQRAAEWRDGAPEPWFTVYDTISVLAYGALAGKLPDPED